MFNGTGPTEFFAPRRPQSENPKSEARNPKQTETLKSKNRNPKPSNENFSRVFKCFEISILSFPFLFRVSDFEFLIYLFWVPFAPLRSPRGVRPWESYLACVEINTPQGESSFFRFPRHKFQGKFQISPEHPHLRPLSLAIKTFIHERT